jgi:hypothetical protein
MVGADVLRLPFRAILQTCDHLSGFRSIVLAHRRGRLTLPGRCNAKAHSRSGSRWPCFANSIISLATSCVAGSLRSTNPSLSNAASNAADNFAMSSRPMSDHVRGRDESARPAPDSTCRNSEMELNVSESQVTAKQNRNGCEELSVGLNSVPNLRGRQAWSIKKNEKASRGSHRGSRLRVRRTGAERHGRLWR